MSKTRRSWLKTIVLRGIRRLSNQSLFRPSRASVKKHTGCREYLDRNITKLPVPFPDDLFLMDQCVACLENIPGILDPSEGYALFELSKNAPARAPIAEVGSYLGKSTSYLALGSLLANNDEVVAIDMFPSREDWHKGEDGFWHIRGSDYYLEDAVYLERKHFFYGDGYYQNTLDIFNDILEKVGLNTHITTFKGTSTSYMISQKLHAKFRLVFIDGDHTYQGVKKDIQAFSGAVVSGGFLCFHDYCSSFPGVVRAVDELILGSSIFQQRYLIKSLLVAKKL